MNYMIKKPCLKRKIYMKKYYKNNREKILKDASKFQLMNKEKTHARNKKWNKKNKEYYKIYHRKWYKQNKEKVLRQALKNKNYRFKNDPIYKFKENVRNLIYNSFKRRNFKKCFKTEQILGCPIEFFKACIEKQLPKGKTIKDLGKFKYHIDHIVPLSSAKTKEDVLRLCHYTNLRPLWWKDNIEKGATVILGC